MTTLGLLVGVLGLFVAIVGGIAQASAGARRLNMPAALRGHEFHIIVVGFTLMSLGLLLAIVAK